MVDVNVESSLEFHIAYHLQSFLYMKNRLLSYTGYIIFQNENELCPLCCEELDISDRQFFPCKCGYQVCMWCWHRIRESESGLCPACRTPYGDDPHEFSAVDMEEVVKANKEKAAAEKREKEKHRQQQLQQAQAAAAGSQSVASYGNAPSIGQGSVLGSVMPATGETVTSVHAVGENAQPQLYAGTVIGSLGGTDASQTTPNRITHRSRTVSGSEGLKDRSLLANMRVIRRNLVYTVGLPPSVATEDILKKSDYFGQYGKITKIVINRNYSGSGDPRRASASAYITFVHKVSLTSSTSVWRALFFP